MKRWIAYPIIGCWFLAVALLYGCPGPFSPPPRMGVTAMTQQCGSAFPVRWIVQAPLARDCAQLAPSSAWTGTPLFAGVANAPQALKRFCILTGTSDGGAPFVPPDYGLQLETPTASTLELMTASQPKGVGDAGCPIPWHVGNPDPSLANPLMMRALKGWGMASPKAGTGAPVLVAIVDNQPQADSVSLYPHAAVVEAVARTLACGSASERGPCAVTFRRYLALPLIGPGREDTTGGGYFGTPVTVATAVASAVSDWLATERHSRLVINLSVGWPGDAKTAAPLMSPQFNAARAALSWARCQGALVIAAAGNAVYPTDAFPLYPAAWETVRAPTTEECAKEYGADAGPAAADPLVTAVAGVDENRNALATTRSLGRPRLAAYAHSVTVLDNDPSIAGAGGAAAYTPVLTGSSVAAAAVSGLAAAWWSRSPGRPASQVIEEIYLQGVPLPLGVSADFGFPDGRPTNIRQVCGLSPTCPSNTSSRGLAELGARASTSVSVARAPISQDAATSVTSPSAGTQPPSAGCGACVVESDQINGIRLEADLSYAVTSLADVRMYMSLWQVPALEAKVDKAVPLLGFPPIHADFTGTPAPVTIQIGPESRNLPAHLTARVDLADAGIPSLAAATITFVYPSADGGTFATTEQAIGPW